MALNALPHIHSTAEVLDSAKNATLLGAGKGAAGALGGAAGGLLAADASLKANIALTATLGLTAAVSASIVQIEHQGKMRKVAKFYKEELAAKLGKPMKSVGEKDLDALASGKILDGVEANPVIAEELQQSRKRRNLGVALSVIASVATYAILEVATLAAASDLAGMAAKAIVGLATYFAVKTPLHWIGDKIFGVDKETTHERIEEISRERAAGKVIGKEQVFSVFVAANPDLARVIENKYRKPYDDLGLKDKQVLTENLGTMMQVDEITSAINAGTINASELAFFSVGQTSGVAMKDGSETGKPHGLVGMVKEKWHDVMGHFSGKHKQQAYDSPAHDEGQKASFAERIGRKHAPDMSHLERVEQARDENPLIQR